MNHKVRVALATAAAGALSCSLVAPAFAAGGGLDIQDSVFRGRIAGNDRYGTAATASRALDNVSRDTVIIANGTSWADTLAATPLAETLSTTVLLTRTDALPGATINELRRLFAEDGVRNVIVLGGPVVVSEVVINELRTLTARDGKTALNLNVDRIAGDDRFETSLLLALEAIDNGALAAARNAAGGLNDLSKREAAYVKAQADYKAAFEAFQAAELAWNKAEAPRAGLLAERAALEKTLLDAIANETAVAAARAAWESAAAATAAAQVKLDTQIAANTALATVPANVLNLTWGQARSNYPDVRTAVEAAVVPGGLAANRFTSLVRSDVNGQIVPLTADRDAKADTQAAAWKALSEALAKTDSVENILKDIAAVQAKINKLDADNLPLWDALVKASTDLVNAQNALTVATQQRPTAQNHLDAQKKYDDAVAAALKASGLANTDVFLATGRDFADALAAGPAAAKEDGVVLLTRGAELGPDAKRWIDAAGSAANVVAVGGPAVTAAGAAADVKVAGADRFHTAATLATEFFDANDIDFVGLASGVDSADAVVGGALLANLGSYGSPLVLTRQGALPGVTAQYLTSGTNVNSELVVLGGPVAISNAAVQQAIDALR